MKKFISVLALSIVLLACNNSSDTSTTKDTSVIVKKDSTKVEKTTKITTDTLNK